MSINNPLNPLNLSNGTYFIRTSDTQNPYLGIRGLDDIVSKGVFSFLLNGSTYLQQGSDIQFEAIDSQGNQISIGGVRNLLKGTSRVVSFEIDDRISNGEATLYISTNLSSYLENGIETDVPSQFVDVPNLLFEYKFQVDKSRVNTDEIIFRKPPTLTVTPSLKTVRDITKTSTTTSTLSGDIKQYYYDDSSASYTLLIESESGTYSFDMNGGVATINNNVDLTIQGIVNVIDSSTIFTTIQNPDIEVYSKEQFKGILSSPVSFTISYITIPDISDTRLQETAIAGIEINDMGVVSGDVAKIKIFGKSDSLNSNYVLLSEVDVENKNLLELEGTGSVGIFDTSKKVGAWSVSKEQVSATNPTIASNDDIFLSGLVINGDYDSPTTVEINGRTLQTPRYVLESDINLQLKKNIEYNLRLNASVSDVSATDTRLDVYVKGSNFTSDNKFGKLVHSFRTDSDKIWRDQFSIVFSVDANTTDGELVFVTTSGRWYVQNIRLTANIQDGFSPQEFRTEIPLNITKPNQDIDFKVEFFDANNNKAEKVLTKDNVIFERPNIVVEGQKNVTVGEMYLGQDSNSGVVTGGSGNGGIVKSFGYEGFAESTGIDGVAGFLMYSGSVLTGSATTYQGVGLELVADNDNFLRFRTDPSEFIVNTQTFFFGNPNSQFISGSGGNIEISSSLFHLDPTNNIMIVSGTIQAGDGIIGGFVISNDALSGDNFYLSGSATGNDFFISSSNFNVKANGDITGSNVDLTGNINAETGTIGNFEIIDGKISGSNITMDANNSTIFKTDQGPGSDPQAPGFEYLADEYYIDFTPTEESPDNFYIKMGPNFMVDKDGILVASGATFTGTITASAGLLGGFVIGSSSLFSTSDTIFISGSPEIGGVDSSEYMFISTSNFNIKENGDITGSNVLFTGGEIGGFTISEDALSSNNFFLSGSATGDDFFISASNMNIKADGQITGSEVLFTGGTVGGFTITDTFISASNLEINSDGTIQTPNFADGVRGFQITALGNGSAQFENVKIRGTLRTTVFEKETVNAVGGQLWVANSTVLSQSVTNSETTMSVENVTGFEVNEILLIKKVDGTGFSSEYVLVESSSRTDGASDTNLSGELYVQRAYADGLPTGSDVTWVTELASSAQNYSDGQVIVSTGKEDTGWILLNASPNNTYTPYIDIVERTGSGVYDYELKARLGDLSGLSTTRLLGNNPATAGFGLYSENVFLEGGIRATFGEIGGFSITDTAISSSNDNLILRSNGQITGSAFLLGDITKTGNYIEYDGGNLVVNGTINIVGGNAATTDYVNTVSQSLTSSITTVSSSAASDLTSTSQSIDGTITNVSSSIDTTITNVSSSLSSSLSDASSSLASDLTSTSSSLSSDIVTNASKIVTDANAKIVKPIPAPSAGAGLYLTSTEMGFYDNSDFTAFISSSGDFLFKKDDDNLISFGNNSFILNVSDQATISGSNINLLTPTFFFGTDTAGQVNYISGSNGNLEISSSNFVIDESGNVTVSGDITITSGDLAGIDANSISGSFTEVSESIDGTITSNSSSIASDLTSTSSSLSSDLTSTSSSLASDLTSTSSSIATDISSNSDRIVTDADNKIIKPNDAPTGGSGLYLSERYLGYYNSSDWNAYISSSGEFLFKKDNDNQISFGNNSFILKVTDEATISGSEVNLVTPTFFFGTDTPGNINYISGSNNNLEISSSNFVLAQNGNVTVSGDITITGGDLAGVTATSISGSFTEVSESIDSTITTNSSSIATDLTNASQSIDTTISNVSSSVATDLTNTSSSLSGDLTTFSSSTANRIVTDAANKIVKPNDAPTGGSGLYLASQYLGYYDSSNWNAYISSSGEFLFKKDNDNQISFGNDSFILKVSDEATISGSSINLVTPTFFFGDDTTFISGSDGNLQIESSNFTIAQNGDVTVSGDITITAGDLAGVNATSISGSFTEVSESIDGTITTNSSSIASDLTSTSSSINSTITDVSESLSSSISDTSSSLASDLTSTSSSIATDIVTNSNKIVTDANAKIVKPIVTPSSTGLFLTAQHLGYYSTVDGWNAYISASGEFLFKSDDNNLVSFADDGFVLKTETATISGSSVNLVTPTFFFGTDTAGSVNYISGSNNNLEISSSNFVLAQNGDVTITGEINAETGTIGGFSITEDSLSSGTNFFISGSATNDDFFISASNFNVKANGNLTASNAQVSGDITATSGQIAGFTISGDVIAGVSYSIDASAGTDGQYFISSSEVKIEGNGDAVFGEYTFSKFNDENNLNGLTRNSDSTNIKILEGRDANGHGALFAINEDGDFYIAPISSSILSDVGWDGFSRELRYDLANDRWEIRQNTYINADLDVTGTISGSILESSGNTTIKGNLTVLGDTTISGDVSGHITVTPVASDSNNSNGVVVQDLTFDEFGHTNTIGTVDLDNRYLRLSGGTLTGVVSSNSQISSTKSTIAFSNLANAAFLAGTTSNGIGIDSNEIVSNGTNINIGTISNHDIRFGTNGTDSQVTIASGGSVGIGTTSPSAELDVEGDVQIKQTNLSYQENTDVDIGTEVVATIPIATYDAVFFDFVVKKGTNIRAGTVYAIHDGTDVEFTETSTRDLGDTSDVTLSVDISSGNLRLNATTTSNDWIVKTFVRSL